MGSCGLDCSCGCRNRQVVSCCLLPRCVFAVLQAFQGLRFDAFCQCLLCRVSFLCQLLTLFALDGFGQPFVLFEFKCHVVLGLIAPLMVQFFDACLRGFFRLRPTSGHTLARLNGGSGGHHIAREGFDAAIGLAAA